MRNRSNGGFYGPVRSVPKIPQPTGPLMVKSKDVPCPSCGAQPGEPCVIMGVNPEADSPPFPTDLPAGAPMRRNHYHSTRKRMRVRRQNELRAQEESQ